MSHQLNYICPACTYTDMEQTELNNIIEKNRQYYLENRLQILANVRDYWKDNKEKLKEKKNQKFICVCGGKYTKTNTSKHFKSDKHLNYITNN